METQTLTTRQAKVLALVAQGLENKEIATALGISENTVEQHLRYIYQRLGVRNRVEASKLFWHFESTGAWR